jgi:hypothetical protein
MTTTGSFAHLSDTSLIAEVKALAGNERQATARLIASLAELDSRQLYLGEGCASLFVYCTQVLRLSEHAAYGRIAAARAARRFPMIFDLLTSGAINLTAVGLLSAHLTWENHQEVLAAATHKTKLEIQQIVARLNPQPAVASIVRKLPEPAAAASGRQPALGVVTATAEPASADSETEGTHYAPPPPKPAVVAPLAPDRYKVQFTISREMHEKLRRVQDLMRHTNPNGDPAVVFDRALTLLLEDLEKKKMAATARPRAARAGTRGSRHIPASVKREVWARDGGQCAFRGANGRCAETGFLEYHHVVPYADGGEAGVGNIELRCRAHNAYESEQRFGPWAPMFATEREPAYTGFQLGLERAGMRD